MEERAPNAEEPRRSADEFWGEQRSRDLDEANKATVRLRPKSPQSFKHMRSQGPDSYVYDDDDELGEQHQQSVWEAPGVLPGSTPSNLQEHQLGPRRLMLGPRRVQGLHEEERSPQQSEILQPPPPEEESIAARTWPGLVVQPPTGLSPSGATVVQRLRAGDSVQEQPQLWPSAGG